MFRLQQRPRLDILALWFEMGHEHEVGGFGPIRLVEVVSCVDGLGLCLFLINHELVALTLIERIIEQDHILILHAVPSISIHTLIDYLLL